MQTLPARDAILAPDPSSPKSYMILQYDSCTGEIVSRSSSLPAAQAQADMRDSGDTILSGRSALHTRPAAGIRQIEDGPPGPLHSKRRTGTLGSVVRKFFPTRTDRAYAGLPTSLPDPPVTHQISYRPTAQKYRPKSTPVDGSPLPSPLTAHPLAVADAGDTAARITQFLGQKTQAQRVSSFSQYGERRAEAPKEETWYDTREVSFASVENEKAEDGATKSSSVSSRSLRRRSRSVGTLSEISENRPQSRLRSRKSDLELAPIKETRRKNTSPVDIGITAYQSRSSGEPFGGASSGKKTSTQTTISQSPTSRSVAHISFQSQAESRGTFNFDNLVDAMREREQVNIYTIEERLNALEVKHMDLEYSISKIHLRMPSASSAARRSDPAGELSATGRGQHARQREVLEPKRRNSPPANLRDEAVTQEAEPGRPRLRSSTSTVRRIQPHSTASELPAEESTSPTVIVPASRPFDSASRGSVTLLTIEHYNALMELLQQERAARITLAEQVGRMQAELTALKSAGSKERDSPEIDSDQLYRSSREARRATMRRGWAAVEEFSGGKSVHRRKTSSQGSRDSKQSNTSSRPRGRPDAGLAWPATPPSPAASDSSMLTNASNDYDTPVEEGARSGEVMPATSSMPASEPL